MKTTILKAVISLVFLIIFNIIYFLGGIEHSSANWCSYGFVTGAYFFLLATPLLAKGSNSAILEGSLWLRAIFYFFTELVVAIVFMFIDPIDLKWPLIVQGILMSIFIVLQFMSVLANDSTHAALQKQNEESVSRQILIDKLQLMLKKTTDKDIKILLNRCIDAMSNSPIQTYPEAEGIELSITEDVNRLYVEFDDKEFSKIKLVVDNILIKIQERNLIIKKCRIR